MQRNRTLTAMAGAAVAAGVLTGIGPAEAHTGFCEEGTIGYRISSPAAYRETGGHTVVIGLTAPARTVTFTHGEDCILESGDQWSVTSAYFEATGTYDGTPASLSDAVTVSVPDSNSELGDQPVTVTLTDSEDSITAPSTVYLKWRAVWRDFNVYYESPTPRCSSTTGTPLHGTGRYLVASWNRLAYLPRQGARLRLLFSPGHSAGDDIPAVTADIAVTNSNGVAHFDFRPPGDRTYFAHAAGNSGVGHADSSGDFVNCN